MPGQFPVYLRLPYRRDYYFCFRLEARQAGFLSILSACIRHQNQGGAHHHPPTLVPSSQQWGLLVLRGSIWSPTSLRSQRACCPAYTRAFKRGWPLPWQLTRTPYEGISGRKNSRISFLNEGVQKRCQLGNTQMNNLYNKSTVARNPLTTEPTTSPPVLPRFDRSLTQDDWRSGCGFGFTVVLAMT